MVGTAVTLMIKIHKQIKYLLNQVLYVMNTYKQLLLKEFLFIHKQ